MAPKQISIRPEPKRFINLPPEQVAHMINRDYIAQAKKAIRGHEDPALFALQVGLALGVLIDSPLKAYHSLRRILGGGDK